MGHAAINYAAALFLAIQALFTIPLKNVYCSTQTRIFNAVQYKLPSWKAEDRIYGERKQGNTPKSNSLTTNRSFLIIRLLFS